MREAIQNLEASKIREVANAGLGRDDVLAFWFGESDEVTPEVIRQAAVDSLQRGETFCDQIETSWGHGVVFPLIATQDAPEDEVTRRHLARFERSSATPAMVK